MTNRKKQGRKRTIALLGDKLNFDIPTRVFRTIRDLTRQHGCQFLYFAGGSYKSPYDFDAQANILYDMITSKTVDGLIIMSNLLSSFVSLQEFHESCLRFHSLPMVSLGLLMEGTPSVVLDNACGMCEAVTHLHEKHACTRFAFISGPRENADVTERFSAFQQALAEHGLVPDPSLCYTGNFLVESGVAAVEELLGVRGKKPGRDFQALVCCNDYMAAGAMLELQRRGIRIPEEVALCGFDGIVFTEFLTPSLSTVQQPFETMAAKATDLLLGLLNGESVPQIVKVATRFMPRHSCGCRYKMDSDYDSRLPLEEEEFMRSPTLKLLEKLNPQVLFSGKDRLMRWKQVISLLQEKALEGGPLFAGRDSSPSRLEAWQAMGRTFFNSFLQVHYQSTVYDMWSEMTSTLELPELLNILHKRLPQVGIQRAYICLYENPENFPGALPPWSRLILAFGPAGREELPGGRLRFPTTELIPQQLLEKYGRQSWVVISIHFHQEKIGFVLMDSDASSEFVFWNLHKQISGTLKGARLLIEHREHSQALVRANATISEFNKQLKDENLRIKAEMEVARNIQTALLPHDIRDIHADFQIAASMLPAEQVGGDYYDVVLDSEGDLWLGIGDVSGHGLIPGLIMMLAQTVHTCITTNHTTDPAEALGMINRVLTKSVKERMNENHYMTCTLLKYKGGGTFQFAGMHQDLLIYRRRTGDCERIETDGLWLNMIDGIERCLDNLECVLERGDVLVLYTDGITETVDSTGHMLDVQGLIEIVQRHGHEEIDAMCKAVLDEVLAWNDGYYLDDMTLAWNDGYYLDDMTLVLARRMG